MAAPARNQFDQLSDFGEALRQLHLNAGAPSYREIQKSSRLMGGRVLSPSGIAEVLNGQRLPTLDYAITLVRALTGSDRNDPEWRERWQRAKAFQRQHGQERKRAREQGQAAAEPQAHTADLQQARQEAERILREARETIKQVVLETEARLREWERVSERHREQIIAKAREEASTILENAHSRARTIAAQGTAPDTSPTVSG